MIKRLARNSQPFLYLYLSFVSITLSLDVKNPRLNESGDFYLKAYLNKGNVYAVRARIVPGITINTAAK